MFKITSFVTTIALLVGTVAGIAAQGRTPTQTLPSTIERAFAKAYPRAMIDRWVAEEREGQPVFEVESHEGAQKRDLIYSADGHLIESEEAITVAALPSGIRQAVQKAYPRATLVSAEHVLRGTTSEYEVRLKGAAVKEVLVNASGVILKAQ